MFDPTASSSSDQADGVTMEQLPEPHPIDSIYNHHLLAAYNHHSLAASHWRAQPRLQLESPFNDTLLGRHFSFPYPILCHDTPSTGGESIVEGNAGGNAGGDAGGNVGGNAGRNVGGPRALSRFEFKILRPKPPDERTIMVRRENLVVLGISTTPVPDEAETLRSYIRLLGVATEEHSRISLGQAKLALALEVHGATTGTAFVSACHKCSTKVSSAPPNPSLFAFTATSGLVDITGGTAQVAFRFRCLPLHHENIDREYRLTVTIWDGEQILARHTFSNCLRIVHHLKRSKGIPIAVLPGDSVVVGTSADSEESRDAPPNAYTSDSSFSRTSAGESQRLVPTQPSYTAEQCPSAPPFAPTPRTNEEFKPEREGGGLPAITAQDDKCVVSHMNPRRGSTNGGEEIYLIVRNLPPKIEPYARFGPNITPTTRIADGVLSCILPAAKRPEVVHVTLCQEPSVDQDSYGTSLVSFVYQCDTSEALLASWLNAKHGSHGVGTGTTSA